jgi:hypothetical protein
MNVFIFQSVPERYDLRTKLRQHEKDTWYASRYRKDMRPGDFVFFWMGGDESFRGLYGWGRIHSYPYTRAGWDTHGVDVIYEVRFEKVIFARLIRNDSTLARMLIFRAPQATNFLLSSEESTKLVRLLADLGEKTPSLVAN